MSKKKKKRKPQQQRNRTASANQPKAAAEETKKTDVRASGYQSDKSVWMRIFILIIAAAMIIGIIVMPFMKF